MVNDLAVPSDVVYFMGSADGIYPEISLMYGCCGGGGGGGSKPEGCSATNGCDVHVHSGTSCDTDKTQGPAQNYFCLVIIWFHFRPLASSDCINGFCTISDYNEIFINNILLQYLLVTQDPNMF